MESLDFVPFSASHFQNYESWFADDELSSRIEKPTKKWLQYIQSDPRARAWAVFHDEALVGSVQVDEGTNGFGSVCVVVKPSIRNNGYGRSILREVLIRQELAHLLGFEGYVEPDNIPVQRCCEASGFHLSRLEPDEEGLLKYIYP